MIAIATLLVVVFAALLVERIASIALIATGLPFEVARFQARSALTGVGYTTNEAESIVNHPIRRRIVRTLMMVGNAGLVTFVGSVIFTFAGSASSGEVFERLGIVVLGLAPIGILSRSRVFERQLTALIVRALARWSELDVRDMVNLMQLTRDYAISEMQVQPGDWVADKPLLELHLPDEGVLVLGIQRADGSFIGAPRGGTVVHAYDMLILYGRSAVLSDLDNRPDDPRGDRAHQRAVLEQEQIMGETDAGGEAQVT